MSEAFVSLVSVIISFVGLMLVLLQLRRDTRQREVHSLIEIYDINRDLLSLGLSDTRLFDILNNKDIGEPELERRYLQLWLNQMALIHAFLGQTTVKGEWKDSLMVSFADFFALTNVQKHWECYGKFYPRSFQATVADMIKKAKSRP